MPEPKKFTVYLDQNIISHIRDGEQAKEELREFLKRLQDLGAIFVYSDVHVEECRAFYDPGQYARVLNDLPCYYMKPSANLEQSFDVTSGVADELILTRLDFADKCTAFLSGQLTVMQFIMGWLGGLEARELITELEEEIDAWLLEVNEETSGFADIEVLRRLLLQSLHSLDLETLKSEAQSQQPHSENEWIKRFTQIDKLKPEDVANFVFSILGDEASKQLARMFPRKSWPAGPYGEVGTLTSLALLLFTQGVGRDSGVRKKDQSRRRKRFRSQFRDCRHLEEASRCVLFLSNDSGAIALARAVYRHAGVKTQIVHLRINAE